MLDGDDRRSRIRKPGVRGNCHCAKALAPDPNRPRLAITVQHTPPFISSQACPLEEDTRYLIEAAQGE